MDDMRLDRRAYTGAPRLRGNVWPDELKPYVKHNWLWDASKARSEKSLANELRKIKRQKIVDNM